MRSPNPLIIEGRQLRDNLTLTGKHPEILRKLNAIVDLAYVAPADAEKLKRLIALAGEQ